MRKFYLLVAFLAASASFAAAQAIQVSSFSGVQLSDGGKVVIRYGPTQQVTLAKGSQDHTSFAIDGESLQITRCKNKCPRGYELEVEIVTPQLAAVAVRDGGTIETRGTFPQRSAIAVAVSQGGAIDVRSIDAGSVTAAIEQGGSIFATAKDALVASISHGGRITYWGNATVVSAVKEGGAVTKGDDADVNKPLSELRPAGAPPLPPPPPLPPIPPVKNMLD